MIKLQPTGTFHNQLVRCGKPNCKCATGRLHGPYQYYFYREYLVGDVDVQKQRRLCRNRLVKVYIPRNQLEEAVKQDKESRAWPKLTLSSVQHLKTRHIKPLSEILENAYKNQNVEKAQVVEEELKKHLGYLQFIFEASDIVNPPESGKLDSAQIELAKVMALAAFAFGIKQSTGKFEYGLPRII